MSPADRRRAAIVADPQLRASARAVLELLFARGFVDRIERGEIAFANDTTQTFASDDGRFVSTVVGDGKTRIVPVLSRQPIARLIPESGFREVIEPAAVAFARKLLEKKDERLAPEGIGRPVAQFRATHRPVAAFTFPAKRGADDPLRQITGAEILLKAQGA